MKTIKKVFQTVCILALVWLLAMTTGSTAFATAATVSAGVFSAIVHTSAAFKGLAFTAPVFDLNVEPKVPDFTELSKADIAKLDEKGLEDYLQKKHEHRSAMSDKRFWEMGQALKKENKEGTDALLAALKKDREDTADTMNDMFLTLKAMRENPTKNHASNVKTLRKHLQDSFINKDGKHFFKLVQENKTAKHGSVTFEMDAVTKGTQGATDIGSRDYLGEIEAGIERQPVRATTILNLFSRKPVSKEYLHFWEEDVVTRDAKFVVACATSTHNTKKTWVKRTVELAKIRDMVDVCIDMLDDYSFVEGEIRQLINESIALKADYELLLGASAAATDMLSIDSIASEFNASNVLADFSQKFDFVTLGDLTAAMKAQIYTFGQERKWDADTVVMNHTDMIIYLHAKNEFGNYLFPNFVSGSTDIINGMRIITSPIVPQNELYVFDSRQGKILDRKKTAITASFENNDNVEHELVTFVASERLQFHVRNINRDAFMKTSDIAAAMAAIGNPNS